MTFSFVSLFFFKSKIIHNKVSKVTLKNKVFRMLFIGCICIYRYAYIIINMQAFFGASIIGHNFKFSSSWWLVLLLTFNGCPFSRLWEKQRLLNSFFLLFFCREKYIIWNNHACQAHGNRKDEGKWVLNFVLRIKARPSRKWRIFRVK